MEGTTLTKSNIVYNATNTHETDSGNGAAIKILLRNVTSPQRAEQMAIKVGDKLGEPVTISMLSYMNSRTKLLQDAKNAFLNSTINSESPVPGDTIHSKTKDPSIHYAQIAITKTSEDTRSTGGGRRVKEKEMAENLDSLNYVSIKKRFEQQRKVSFKIKSASTNYRRPPLATKTVTITSSKVAQLTKKFNDLISDSNGAINQSRLVKTIEHLQTASKCSMSNSSTPSSTLSSSPNIKIVLRPKRGSKKRSKKRCSSVDAIDQLCLKKSSPTKVCVIRSKSDGTKKPKTKKRLRYNDSSEQQSGSDSVDGSPTKPVESEKLKDTKVLQKNVVRNTIKKFECEINAKINNDDKRKLSESKVPLAIEKPKVPEKKSSLTVTKNLVVKDGVPKIKTVKPTLTFPHKIQETRSEFPDINLKKKEPIYDIKKYKTNYIHTDRLPLKVVEIIHEDIDENIETENINEPVSVATTNSVKEGKDEKTYEEISSRITPNESFLWRRKSGSQTYSDSERSASDSPYSLLNMTSHTNISSNSLQEFTPNSGAVVKEEKNDESQNTLSEGENKGNESNSDFESNLVEACNKEVIIGYTSKPKRIVVEDDYEPLQPVDTVNELVVAPVRNSFNRRSSKKNCPLPEIPKDCDNVESRRVPENVYQCLLEMRSHPEGDESSLHSYELCENRLEERTRGDGDSESDDGYDYCISPVKPYCHTSSSGIRIAEDYQPYPSDGRNTKNYEISKSVSATSTVSYEKIGPDRIYEKIPAHVNKYKDLSPPSYSKRDSIASSEYTNYNDGENIYDTIRHADGVSLSHCYESIPNSPSMVKLRNNLRKQLASTIQKRLSFDNVSNISRSTVSSEQKTNSIYGQRSMLSFNGQEIAFRVPNSDTSASDRSDRSDDWVDVSDEEKGDEQKIIM
ncbi:hypothetical protein EVAR_53485_1 [Eumeta japonica]|uniref:Uncharacterized protein n=1 Tax=Eumeta variegata TaxID=151549 RepID=A0A4C1YQY4_EUMVA|nr:hypothetical protein EVAR_53485_1 [Eumeta japonica]